jgi:hypothetical protein
MAAQPLQPEKAYSAFQMGEPQCRGLVTKPLPRFCGLLS